MNKSTTGIITTFFYSGILCLLFFLMAGCLEKPREALRVGTSVWVGYEPLFLAREKGYFSDSDVKLIEYTSQTTQVRAF